jgi:DNA-binding response OmpR family regulator
MLRQGQKTAPRLPGILVVDDERQIVDLLTRYLVQHGFRAVGAYDAAEARERVRSDLRIAVIVSDVRMPGESGVALAEELVRDRSDAAALEVVLITGADLAEAAPTALSSQGFEILHKPFRPSEMAAAVTRALATSERRRRAAMAEAPVAETASASTADAMVPATGPEALRAPLLPIIAAAEALVAAAALDEAETREQARRIHAAALRLLAMIEENHALASSSSSDQRDDPSDEALRTLR